MIRVLVVDDQPLFRTALAQLLATQPQITVVGEAANGQQALALAQQLHPDVILMDVQMPEMDGVEATRRISAQLPACRVIMLSTYDHDEYVLQGMRAGAVGYVLKDVTTQRLVEVLEAAMQGMAVLQPVIATKLVDFVRMAPSPPILPEARHHLPQMLGREVDILRLIAQGYSNQEIGDTLCFTEGTVKQYILIIRRKLEARDRAHAVMIARETGII